MKEVKLLYRVQAVLHLYNSIILAAIQDHALKSELASNYFAIIHYSCNLMYLQKVC